MTAESPRRPAEVNPQVGLKVFEKERNPRHSDKMSTMPAIHIVCGLIPGLFPLLSSYLNLHLSLLSAGPSRKCIAPVLQLFNLGVSPMTLSVTDQLGLLFEYGKSRGFNLTLAKPLNLDEIFISD